MIGLVEGFLEDGGYDSDSLPDIIPHNNPQGELGFFDTDEQGRVIVLNVGAVRTWIDQIRDATGYDLPLDSPVVVAYLLYVTIHELEHSDCCHGDHENTVAQNCREVLADINGAKATCDFVAALVAALTGPPSEFMLTLLHALCAQIQGERDKYNNAEGRSKAADCKDWSDGKEANGEAGGCQCTSGSWDPPKPDPCSDCPDFPDPGNDPDNPFGGGDVIPACEPCNHI